MAAVHKGDEVAIAGDSLKMEVEGFERKWSRDWKGETLDIRERIESGQAIEGWIGDGLEDDQKILEDCEEFSNAFLVH